MAKQIGIMDLLSFTTLPAKFEVEKIKVWISFTFQVKFFGIFFDFLLKHGNFALHFYRDNSRTSMATLINADTFYLHGKNGLNF